MTRDEAKILMRKELESDLTEKERHLSLPNYNGLSCNDLMAEVEKGSELGQDMLNDFILSKDEEAILAGATTMDQATKEVVLLLMQKDVDTAPKGWVDQPISVDDQGNGLTPPQVMQQVKDGTDWGNRYARTWLDRYRLYQTLDDLYDVLGSGTASKLFGSAITDTISDPGSKDTSKLN
jgi:hypothetical protein